MRPGVPAASGGPVLGRTPASGGAGLSRATVAGGERRAETQVSPTAYLYSRVRVCCSLTLSIRDRILPHLDLLARVGSDTIVRILDRVVVDRVGDALDQEEYLAVFMVRPRSSMEIALGQRRRCRGDARATPLRCGGGGSRAMARWTSRRFSTSFRSARVSLVGQKDGEPLGECP